MDGKPLYEYAREGIPLPRPIEARDAHVYELELLDWKDAASEGNPSGHSYSWPTKELSAEDRERAEKVKSLVIKAEEQRPAGQSTSTTIQMLSDTASTSESDVAETRLLPPVADNPPILSLRMVVSSGTYVRSIIHDIGLALGSAAHVVSLKRTVQGDFSLDEDGGAGNCVPWSAFEKAFQDQDSGVPASGVEARTDESLRAEWEREICSKWHEK